MCAALAGSVDIHSLWAHNTNLCVLQISITFKNQQVLKDVSWDVKKGEKVGLVGVNGAGKTTQLQIITGALQPDAGNVIKAKDNMRIAYLTQEFDVTPSNTVREEFMSAFGEQVMTQCCCLHVAFAASCNAARPMLHFTPKCTCVWFSCSMHFADASSLITPILGAYSSYFLPEPWSTFKVTKSCGQYRSVICLIMIGVMIMTISSSCFISCLCYGPDPQRF